MSDPSIPLMVRYSAQNAVAELKATYTVWTWTFGWLVRMLAQVCFFALLGKVMGSSEHMRFLVLGNSLMICAVESMMVVAAVVKEREYGTLPLIVASPGRLIWVYVGRSLHWPFSGAGTSLVALLGLCPLFGVTWEWRQVPWIAGLVVLTAVTTYVFGIFFAVAVFHGSDLRNIVSNVVAWSLAVVCGVQVPVAFWPGWVEVVAWFVPITHALQGVRELQAGADVVTVLPDAGLAVLTAAGWLGAAQLLLHVLIRRAILRGRIDFT